MGALLKRPVVIVLALVVVGGLVAGGIFLQRGAPETAAPTGPGSAPAPVQVTAARTGAIRTVLTYSGAISPAQQVNLAPRLAGQLASITVDVGAAVKTGDTLATLDQGTLPAQLQQAQAGLLSAQARLQLMLDGPRAYDVAAAEAALAAAEARLRQLLNPTPADLSAAESALRSAETTLNNARVTVNSSRNSLVSAISTYCNVFNAVYIKCETPIPVPQEDLDKLSNHIRNNTTYALSVGGSTGIALISANNTYVTSLNNLANAETAHQAAQDRYAQVRFPSASDIAAQRSAVETARATLDNRRQPYTDADIAGARAAVATAQAAVAAARTALDQTAVVAPFDGVIAQKLLEVGATVSPQTPIFVMVAKAVETHLTVDEARIGLIQPNMDAEVTVPAYPNKVFKGKVTTIAPLGDARAHTFDVEVIAEDRESQLRPGMFAQVNVIAATKPNAILVPSAAIVAQGQTSRVFIVQGGKAVAKTVKLGIADTTSTEITEGVAAGDQVVTVGQNVLRDGQAVTVATPGAGGARPSGSPTGTPPGGATPAATGTAGAGGSPTGSPAGSPRPSGTGTPR